MRNHQPKLKALALFLVGVSLLVVPRIALAAFSMTVRPLDSGQELDFSPATPGAQEINRELNINIATTLGAQYELRQEPLTPLRNGKGNEIPWDSLSVRGLRATNKFGTLKSEPFKVINSILYTSNTNGSPDSFTLVYTLNVPLQTAPDFYRGQIKFTITPLGSSENSVSVFLNIIAQVTTEERGEVKPFIEIATPSGSRTISLSSKNEEAKSFDVLIKVNGKLGKAFRIKQFLPSPLESAEGKRLAYEAVSVGVKEVRTGTAQAPAPLSVSPQVIYASGLNGEADSNFVITYNLGDLSNQKAGRYKSRVQYILEEAGAETKLETLELEVEVEKIFNLVATVQDAKGSLEFTDIKPMQEAKRQEVTIEIKSNLGKRYQANQNLFSELTNMGGDKMPETYFTVRTESQDTKGILKIVEKRPAAKGDTALFVSDDQGSPDKFKVIYELGIPGMVNLKAGNYNTKITYSLLEL